MTTKEVREKYLRYFRSSPRNHTEIPSAPIILENDPTTLFTSSGMQPLVPYLMGEPHPSGSKRLTDSQPSLRLQDIDEVGDNHHTTFFEMLGNWSLGDYFKKEQLSWIWEFFTKELSLSKENLWVSVFRGVDSVRSSISIPKDTESYEIWKSLGITVDKIYFYGVEHNWWSRSGTPEQMPVGEIGGPDTEIFFDFGQDLGLHEKSPFRKQKCHPNCNCGRFLEIGNSVFIQFQKTVESKLKELPNKNVDFGGGLERIVAAVNNKPDIFEIDSFSQTIRNLEKFTGLKYAKEEAVNRNFRIIADHLRACLYLISEGVRPSNKLQGYVLRRLLRRAVFRMKLLGFDLEKGMISQIAGDYKNHFEVIKENWNLVKEVVDEEALKFNDALKRGLKKLDKLIQEGTITGKKVFDLYQSDGFPFELTLEILEERGQKFSQKDRAEFEEEFKDHVEKSRTTSSGVFKGGLVDHSPEVIKLHTATHLLLSALKKVLGKQITQKGQNINKARSRFDIPLERKLTNEELRKVEDSINHAVLESLPVNSRVMSKDEALGAGADHAFDEKYKDTVKVYYIGKDMDNAISKEFCGGPHVKNTSEIGRVKIIKQEKIGAGLLRIYIKLVKPIKKQDI